MTEAEYNAAREKHNEAARKFHAAQDAYRARKTNDEEFLKARAEYDAATKEFDAAFAEMEASAEAEHDAAVEQPTDDQPTLF